ncbi:MAG: HAD-IIIA family hydrolase [Rhodospirillaceae bacterium]|jgi:D-glycero-D-manno-heptose 1,7-bisphosphate phosphatase|nr:HAD-IIIA family hydrolase [Rhodospirillaceae bacterium]MBT5895513.1 HAD-IIIA family hydrolase [Rhodospirillaceae bacterium]MBT6427122.1 HAD-IIIA family hydrolase [Rhodospirillaceae bacterium]
MAKGPSFIDNDGVWVEILGQRRTAPALFLDRDGVVVVETHYLHEVEKTELIPGAGETIALANRRGLHVVLVTNQSGVGRGLYGWAEFEAVQDRIKADLAAFGAHVDAVCACPFHPDAQGDFGRDHPDRKPNPGMLMKATQALGIDLAPSWIIGDMHTDMGAGRNAGLAGGVHVQSGWPDLRDQALAEARADFPVLGANSIDGVRDIIPLLAD